MKKSIDMGKSESTPVQVSIDDNCAFGKWLHNRIEPPVKGSPVYNEIVDIHALFHKEAATILECALNGNKLEANRLIKIDGDFAKLSNELTAKLKLWKKNWNKSMFVFSYYLTL